MRRLIASLVGLGGIVLSFAVLANENFDDHDDIIQEGADIQSVVVSGQDEPTGIEAVEQYQNALQEAKRRGDSSLVDQLIRREDVSASPTPKIVVVGVEELPFELLDISLDRDQDGLSDGDEIRLLTDPNKSDTDGDGYIDSLEVIRGYNPLIAGPGDNIEYKEPTGRPNAQYRITGIRLTGSEERQMLTVTGTGPVNALVAILIYSTENKTWITRTDKTGRFLFTSIDALDPGNYNAYAASVSSNGEPLAASAVLAFERTISSLIKKVESSPQAETPNDKKETKMDSVIIIVGAVGVVVILGVLTLIWKKRKKEKGSRVPVIVDLDGTLVKTDTLFELFLRLVKHDLFGLWRSVWWLRRGKANLKRELVNRVSINVETLPYRGVVIDYIKEVKASGRKVVLATASDIGLAQKIASHLRLFDEVIGSDGQININGTNKAKALVEKFGKRKFEYIGNSRADLPVWANAKVAHIVSNSHSLRSQVKAKTQVGMCWMSWYVSLGTIIKVLRPHQWVKNLLIFMPMLADHQFGLVTIGKASLAFVVFSLTASSVYVVNDLLDIEADRRHATKKNRPFASGSVPILVGIIIVPIFMGIAGAMMFVLPPMFMAILLGYFALNLLYSFGIKQVVLLDVIVLAVLYTLRVLAGGEVVGITVSAWLMALTLFLALSGALMKRYIELSRNSHEVPDKNLAGRGYLPSDITIVGQLGIISGYLSVLVLALYVNSSQVRELYRLPEFWWLVALLLLYAISRGWLYAYRGKIDDDPIMYILKDPVNYWILGLTVFLVLLAS